MGDLPTTGFGRVTGSTSGEGRGVVHFPRVGERFGAYFITGELGRGGMGVVFAAVQEPLGRRVALKVLDARVSSDPEFVTRFARECDLLARTDSPHVIQVYDHGQLEGCLYLAMQHVTGGDLGQYLHSHGPLAPALAADLTAQIASALADAHAVGIVHRDVKPSNVLLARTGGDLFAYLCDFGIAQRDDQQLTRTGMLSGSLPFTAPERHQGRPADERSDVYSLGCLFWCLLTGSNPYSGTDYQVAQQHFTAPVPRLTGSGPVVEAINYTLASLMAKDPALRPASAVEAMSRLRAIQRLTETTGADHATRAGHPVPTAQPGGAEQSTRRAGHGFPSALPAAGAAPTTLAATIPPAPPGATPPTPAPQPPAAPPRRSAARVAGSVVAVVVAAALLGTGGTWAYSSLMAGQAAPSAPVTSVATPSTEVNTTPAPADSTSTATTRTAARQLIDEIDLPNEPHGIAVNPGSRLAFVANYGDKSVSVINLDTNSVVRKISVGAEPQSVIVDPASGLLLVGCDGVPAVQLYELQSYQLVGSISTGKSPIRIATQPSQKVAYAIAQGSRSMGVISLSTHDLIQTVKVRAKPRSIAVDERDQIAYIGHWDSTLLSVIDLNARSEIARLEVGRNANAVAIAPEARLAFVAGHGRGTEGGGTVSIIDLDTRSVLKAISADDGPSRLAVDEAARVVYVTCLYAKRVDVIDLDSLTIVNRLKTAARPTGIAVDSSTGRLYVTSFDGDVVQVFGN